MTEKKYIKGIWAKEINGQFGKFMNVSIKVDAFIEELKANVDKKGYVSLTISPRKEAGKFGETHNIYLNQFKPEQNDAFKDAPTKETPNEYDNSSQLPF